MPLGSRGSGTRAPRTHYPTVQGPDTGPENPPGGGGGGGEVPTAPSNVTTAIPGSTTMSWGGYGHVYKAPALYQTWKTNLGFRGYKASLANPYLGGYGNSQTMKGSSAAGEASTNYNWQKAYEGIGITAINGGVTNQGPFKAKEADPTLRVYLGIYVNQKVYSSLGPFGDMFNASIKSDTAAKMGLMAAGVNFLGGNGLTFDLEVGDNWKQVPAGRTAAEWFTNYEAWGFQCGSAIYAAFPACHLVIYSWVTENSWHAKIIENNGAPPSQFAWANDGRNAFLAGVFRGHVAQNATGRIDVADHAFYRGLPQVSGCSLVTALKWNTQGRCASLSRNLPAATWNKIAPLFGVSPFSWAGTDPAGFNTATQEGEPLWTQNQELYRKWSMGGFRVDYTSEGDGSPDQNAGSGIWAPGNNYTTPPGRPAGMVAATSTSGSFSTTVPVLSASKSGSGTTRTITGTASHAYGIHYIKIYLYPSGTPVYAQMTFNSGTTWPPTAGLDNAYMQFTAPLTGLTVGVQQYAIVTACSTLNQQKSVVVTL